MSLLILILVVVALVLFAADGVGAKAWRPGLGRTSMGLALLTLAWLLAHYGGHV